MAKLNLLKGESNAAPEGMEPIIITSREWAASVLKDLEERCFYGAPPNYSAFDIGRALGRALSNSIEDAPGDEVIRGYLHYLARKHGSSD